MEKKIKSRGVGVGMRGALESGAEPLARLDHHLDDLRLRLQLRDGQQRERVVPSQKDRAEDDRNVLRRHLVLLRVERDLAEKVEDQLQDVLVALREGDEQLAQCVEAVVL